jgi:hypothetical protein
MKVFVFVLGASFSFFNLFKKIYNHNSRTELTNLQHSKVKFIGAVPTRHGQPPKSSLASPSQAHFL